MKDSPRKPFESSLFQLKFRSSPQVRVPLARVRYRVPQDGSGGSRAVRGGNIYSGPYASLNLPRPSEGSHWWQWFYQKLTTPKGDEVIETGLRNYSISRIHQWPIRLGYVVRKLSFTRTSRTVGFRRFSRPFLHFARWILIEKKTMYTAVAIIWLFLESLTQMKVNIVLKVFILNDDVPVVVRC